MTRYALVTGASSGIGAATAVRLSRDGFVVLVHFNSDEAAARATLARCEAARPGPHHVVQGDLATEDGVTATLRAVEQTAGDLSVLVNNAGSLVARSAFEDLLDENVRLVVDLNFTSVILLTRGLLPGLKRQQGAVVNLASIASFNGGGGGSAIYGAAKGAIVSLTRALAKEVAPAGVRVNAVAPGVIETPFHERFTKPEVMAAMLKTIPMARAGTAEECADLVSFLAGSESRYITGQTIHINGGQYFG
jgi:3-oxoacyl-[acyl-carrier protein] reductase